MDVVRRARKTVPSTTRQICDECGLLFANHKEYLEHLVVFHDPKDPGRYYVCGACGQLFHTLEERRLHDADHDAAAIITAAERSSRVRNAHRSARPPIPPHLRAPPPPPVSHASHDLNQPLRLDIHPAKSGLTLGTISAPATPHAPWSPPLNSAAPSGPVPPPAKRPRPGPSSAPLPPSESACLYTNPPPPEPCPTAVARHSPPKIAAPPPAQLQHTQLPQTQLPQSQLRQPETGVAAPQPLKPGGGAWSKCPRCLAAFASAWLMLEHAITVHSARLVRLERKCFDEAMQEKRAEVYEGLDGCPFCTAHFAHPSNCLLHIVQEHRSNTGLYESPEWAHRVVVSAEVVYLSATPNDARELKFKINVTLKVRK